LALAGATRYYYSAFYRNEDDHFANELKNAGIERFVFGAIAPRDMECFKPKKNWKPVIMI
jgi:hypothetical protein